MEQFMKIIIKVENTLKAMSFAKIIPTVCMYTVQQTLLKYNGFRSVNVIDKYDQ